MSSAENEAGHQVNTQHMASTNSFHYSFHSHLIQSSVNPQEESEAPGDEVVISIANSN